MYKRKLRCGRNGFKIEEYEVNRLDQLILMSLKKNDCIDKRSGMTITEIIYDNTMEDGTCVLGVRMTVYRKLKRLLNTGYIACGIVDNHADTYYLVDKGRAWLTGEADSEKGE